MSEREDVLIRRHIVASGGNGDDARVKEYGTPVWSLVAYSDVVKGDMNRVAADYELPEEAVEAAMAYYRQNKAVIDARLLLNEAA